MKPPAHSRAASDAALDQGEGSRTGDREIIEERLPHAKYGPWAALLLTMLAVVAFFYGLGGPALLGPDEPRYAEVAREMFTTGDYISPRLCGCLWFEKPALFYWVASVSYRVFGVGEFGARFPSALAAAVTALFLGWWLWRSGFVRLGPLVSFVLMTSGLFIAYARAATPDMLLAACVGIALVSGYSGANSTSRKARIRSVVLCGAATGLSVLAKGLVGMVLIAAILGLYLVIIGRLKATGRWTWIAGFLLAAGVAAVWYVPVTVEHGWSFIEQFFIEHHFKRYVTNRFYHPQPFYFYPAIAVFGTAPWSFILLCAGWRLSKLRPRANRRDSLLTLAWLWALLPMVFFSFSVSKLPGYILPVFPALAIVIGSELERVWVGERTTGLKIALWMTAIGFVALSFGAAIFFLREGANPTGWLRLGLWLPTAIAIAAAVVLARTKMRVFLLGAGALVASLIFGATTILFPAVNNHWSRKQLSLEAASALRSGEKIGFFIDKEYAPVFYSQGRVECGQPEGDILNALREDRLAEALQGKSSMIVITLERWRKGLEEDGRFDLEFIGSQGEVLAYRVTMKPR